MDPTPGLTQAKHRALVTVHLSIPAFSFHGARDQLCCLTSATELVSPTPLVFLCFVRFISNSQSSPPHTHCFQVCLQSTHTPNRSSCFLKAELGLWEIYIVHNGPWADTGA